MQLHDFTSLGHTTTIGCLICEVFSEIFGDTVKKPCSDQRLQVMSMHAIVVAKVVAEALVSERNAIHDRHRLR